MSDDGAAVSVKVAAAATVSVTVVCCWMPPPLPVTAMGYVPTGVPAPTVIVMVELPEPGAAMGFGLKLTVVPAGIPAADKAIDALNPPLIVDVMVELPWLPCGMVSEAGDS